MLKNKYDEMSVLEEEDFDSFFEELDKISDDPEEPTVSPDSKNDLRKWVSGYLKMSKDMDWVKKEYIPFLIEKFITPSKRKLEKLAERQDIIKGGLQEFLEEIEEKKVNFPELGTVFIKKTQKKIIYPSDEKDLIDRLVKKGDDRYLTYVPKINKKKILEEYKETGIVPLEGVTGEEEGVTVNIRRVNNRGVNENL